MEAAQGGREREGAPLEEVEGKGREGAPEPAEREDGGELGRGGGRGLFQCSFPVQRAHAREEITSRHM